VRGKTGSKKMMNDEDFATGVAEWEAVFQDFEKRGLIVRCNQRWAERGDYVVTPYALAPGVTQKDLDAALCAAYDEWAMMLPVASAQTPESRHARRAAILGGPFYYMEVEDERTYDGRRVFLTARTRAAACVGGHAA
jgi:hypothetical protein